MKRRIWRLIGYVLFFLFIGTYPASHFASPGDAALNDEDCYAEIASIDYGDGSEKLENNRFRHVFQYIDTYPYYRRVSEVYVGIETVRYFPDSTRPNRSYWSIVDGRKGVGAEGHYSLIHDFRGEANVLGVAVSINVADEFAFFLYDRDSDTNAGHHAHGARAGLLDVMTTIEDKAEFINVEKASSWRIGTNTKLRAWSSRFVDSDGDWNEGIYSNKLFRTLYFIESQVTVAGVEREVNKICRLAWSPVANNEFRQTGSGHRGRTGAPGGSHTRIADRQQRSTGIAGGMEVRFQQLASRDVHPCADGAEESLRRHRREH